MWQISASEDASHVLEHHYAMLPESLEQLIRKSVNTVWRLRSARGDFVLKRLGRSSDPGWLKFQHAAITEAAAQGVPVQTLVETADGATTVDCGGTQWQLRSYAVGRPYVDGDLSDLRRTADCLAMLHSVPLERLPGGGANPVQDMEHWLTTDESGMDELEEVVAAVVPRDVWAAARLAYTGAYRRARSELDWLRYDSLPKVLTHGEFAGSNIVFDEHDGTVSCVLDWDGVDIRPRAYDLARAALFLARKERGKFTVYPELATELLIRATADRPAETTELAAIVPILELYCVPTVRYVSQLAEHSPETLAWYLGWAAEGAAAVRAALAPPVARAAAKLGPATKRAT